MIILYPNINILNTMFDAKDNTEDQCSSIVVPLGNMT